MGNKCGGCEEDRTLEYTIDNNSIANRKKILKDSKFQQPLE